MSTQLVAARPQPAQPRPYRFPPLHVSRLASGLQVIACPLPGRSVAAVRLLFEAGAENEAAHEGAAALAASALTEGTEQLDAAAFARACERIGAEIWGDAGWDAMHLRLNVPVERLGPAMELLAGAARTPAFDEKEVARLRAERLNELLQEYADAGRRARHAFMPALYSPDSPYSRPAAGSLAGVGALTPAAAADYYRRFATPGSATLIVAGDVDAAAVEDLAAEAFGSWEGPEPERQAPPAKPAAGARGCVVVHRPGSVQSHILAGHIGLPRRTEDFFEVTAMVTVLGGLFTSRINMRLREEKGYTYGARAAFDFRRRPGPFAVSTAVETSVTGPAAADIAAELRAMRDGGVTEAELAEAKDYLVGVFPLAFETSDAIAGAVAHLVVYGLGLDHYDSYREKMAAVGVAGASEAARRRLDPEGLSVVVAGDAAAVEPQLAGLGLGPVAVVEDQPRAAGA